MAEDRGAAEREEQSVATADGRLGIEGVREADARLHVVHVRVERRALVVIDELDDAARVVAGHLDRRLRLEIPVAHAILRLPARHVEVVAQTEIQGQLLLRPSSRPGHRSPSRPTV